MSLRCYWLGLAFLAATAYTDAAPMPEALTPVPFPDVHIHDDFWGQRLRINRTSTIEANLRQCEITGRIKNFAVAGGLEKGKHEGELYNDSDVYKVLEGVAYALADQPRPRSGEARRRDHRPDRRRPAAGRLPRHLFHPSRAAKSLEERPVRP